jgi:hypothetical protein
MNLTFIPLTAFVASFTAQLAFPPGLLPPPEEQS